MAASRSKKSPVKTKAVVGSAKKHRSFRLTPKSFTVTLAVIGVLSIFASLGVSKWQDHQLKAQAAGWTTVASREGALLVACKVAINTGYGPLWEVRTVLANGSSRQMVGDLIVYRNGQYVGAARSDVVSPGKWGVVKVTYASRILGDTWGAYVSPPSGNSSFSTTRSFNEITGC